jgi:hypothetical protein
VDALRDIVSDLMDLPEVNRHMSRLLSGVAIRYTLPYEAIHPLAGTHCPLLTIDGVTPLDALAKTGRPLLLHPDAKSIEVDRQIDTVPAATLGRDDLTAALLRPDGVLAWAAAPGDDQHPPQLREALDAWFPSSPERG